MDNFSDIDAYVLSSLGELTPDSNMGALSNAVLKIYSSHLNFPQIGEVNHVFFSIFNRLKNLELLTINKKVFYEFFVNNVFVEDCCKIYFSKNKMKNTVDVFIKKMLSSFNFDKKKHAKYEVRFFWPSEFYPEVYDLEGLMFNKEFYSYKVINDKYILYEMLNIKTRDNEIQFKRCIKEVDFIYQFKKKKKLSFPVKGAKLKKFLNQEMISESDVFQTPEDLITQLSAFLDISCVDIMKKRYVRKIENHTKIEFAHIKIQEKEWKTICIESKHLENVLALSLLINQENAEKMSYGAFLQKYGTVLDDDRTK